MEKAIELIKKIEVVSFKWKDTNLLDTGFIAEEVAKIIPEAVYYKDGLVEGIRILPILAIAVEAIKELNEKVERWQIKQ